MMITGFKAIAEYVAKSVGDFSERSARRHAKRARDPLPVVRFGRSVKAKSDKLDAWVSRQMTKPAWP